MLYVTNIKAVLVSTLSDGNSVQPTNICICVYLQVHLCACAQTHIHTNTWSSRSKLTEAIKPHVSTPLHLKFCGSIYFSVIMHSTLSCPSGDLIKSNVNIYHVVRYPQRFNHNNPLIHYTDLLVI